MGMLIGKVVEKLVDWIRERLGLDEEFDVGIEDGGEARVSKSGVDVELPDRGSEAKKRFRKSSYRSDSESKIADRAAENSHIFSDVMDDPGLVGADSEVEAVAKVAVENPGWASFVDFEADLGVDPGEVAAATDGDTHAGESMHGESGEGSPDFGGSGSDSGSVETASESAYTPAGPSAHGDLGGNSVGGSGSGGDGGSGGAGNSADAGNGASK
jgi:hypothetical protein